MKTLARRIVVGIDNASGRIGRAKKRGDREAVRDLVRTRRLLPTGVPDDPGYRRLRYVRYADLSRARDKSA